MAGNEKAYEVLGIGAPFLDHVVQVTDEFLSSLPGCKGGMQPVSHPEFLRILRECGSSVNLSSGGSCSNTIKGLANLDHRCALTGTIGNDDAGKTFLKGIHNLGIVSLHVETNTPTGQLACLVTPDGQRTFRNFLGASQEMKPQFLTPEIFKGVSLVHIEGYSLMNEAVAQRAMKLAKHAGAKISFDLASFELAAGYKAEIVHLLSRHVDILFANIDEVKALTLLGPERGCTILKDLCETVVVLMGKEGCFVGHGDKLIRCPAYPVNPLDTTGAGDLFAAGFLHGYLTGSSLIESAHYGALAGAEVVQIFGSEIPQSIWDDLRAKILSTNQHKHAKEHGSK